MPDEKFDEKEMEKRDEKAPEEKGWDEKWRRDPLGAIIWAVIFIYAGCVFLAANLGLLNGFIVPIPGLPETIARIGGAWSIVLIGAGLILLVEVLIRLLVPIYRRPVVGTFIFAVILIALGLGEVISWNIVWPMLLIALGLWVLFRGFRRKE